MNHILDASGDDFGYSDKATHDEAFKKNTHNEQVLWEAIANEVSIVINTAYGTDPRHTMMARAAADKIAYGKPIPWGI